MSQNFLVDTSYRNLDVDAYDPDAYVEGAEDGADTPGIGPDESQVRQLLQSNKNIEALKAALLNPPLRTKNQSVKDKSTALLAKVLLAFKIGDIGSAVAALNSDEIDILMKYIYKAMELLPEGQQSCTSLLAWHAQAFASCGHGGIVRVLCDRNRL